MQLLHYRPVESGEGVFNLPLPAIMKYLEPFVESRRHRKRPYGRTMETLVAAARSRREIVAVSQKDLIIDDFAVAEIIEQGSYTVHCPHCDTTFTPSQVQRGTWAYYNTAEDAGGGRDYRCTLGHLLLAVQDWMS